MRVMLDASLSVEHLIVPTNWVIHQGGHGDNTQGKQQVFHSLYGQVHARASLHLHLSFCMGVNPPPSLCVCKRVCVCVCVSRVTLSHPIRPHGIFLASPVEQCLPALSNISLDQLHQGANFPLF